LERRGKEEENEWLQEEKSKGTEEREKEQKRISKNFKLKVEIQVGKVPDPETG